METARENGDHKPCQQKVRSRVGVSEFERVPRCEKPRGRVPSAGSLIPRLLIKSWA